jgi:hypothetical protein
LFLISTVNWVYSTQEAISENEAAQPLDKVKLKELKSEFETAKKFISNHKYFYAGDILLSLSNQYPTFKEPAKIYKKTITKMLKAANDDQYSFEEIAYAKAYLAYFDRDYLTALNELSKYIHFTEDKQEAQKYINLSKQNLRFSKPKSKNSNETDISARAKKILKSGIEKYNSQNYVACIKTLEKLINFDDAYSADIAEYKNSAKEYINKSVTELSNLVKSDSFNNQTEKDAAPQTTVDKTAAEQKYLEGLALYNQGREYEAARFWEHSLRLNPKHKKAKVALNKLQV